MVNTDKSKKAFLNWIESNWLGTDLRFGQMLITLGIIQDNIIDWNQRICDYPIPHEILREIQTWVTYGKDGKSKPREIFIKDLEDEHIRRILLTQEHISKNLRNALNQELILRNFT